MPRTTSTLRAFAMPARPPVSLPTTLSFQRAQLVEVDLRRAERDAVLGERLRLVHDRGDVQQRLRRDAADVEADAAQRAYSARRAPSSCRDRRRGTRRCSRPGRRRAPASRIRRRPCPCSSRRRDRDCRAARAPSSQVRRSRRSGFAGARLPPMAARVRGGRSAASSTTISVPSLTLSPSLTLTSFTVPAAGAGTSIVALSDSSVTSESSAATVSPGFTKTSMTGMSLKSPMSGTLTSSAH